MGNRYPVYLLIVVFCTVFHVIFHQFPIHHARIQLGLVVYFYQLVPIPHSPPTFSSHLPKSHCHETPPQAEFACLALQLHCWALTSNTKHEGCRRGWAFSVLTSGSPEVLQTQGKMVRSAANWCTHLIRTHPLQRLSNFRYSPSLLLPMETIGEGPQC